jgi:hypothetical protein
VASTNSALFSAPSRSSSLSSFAKENDARLTHHFSPRPSNAGAEADDNNLFHLTTRQGEAAALILHPITQQKVKAGQHAAMTCA